MELPDEASSVIPEAAVATIAALGEFADSVSQDGQSFIETSVNPLTRKLFAIAALIFSVYGVVTWIIAFALHTRNSHARKLGKLKKL